MIRMILSGCNGKMGQVISQNVRQRENCTIVAGIDLTTDMTGGFPVFARADECTVEADVLVDFSHPAAVDSLLKMAVARKLPVVIATTGLSQQQLAHIDQASQIIPVFHSSNMSLGVNLLAALAKQAAKFLQYDFDIEILEKHHSLKVDAPSGTAVMLAKEVASVLDEPYEFVYDRHNRLEKRPKKEIGLHSIRGGTIVGEHDIIFAGHDEVITISHSATSKEVFATGSINAALFLAGKPAGLYGMSDMI
ncbi:4-hydroxy-tetrahydrodipicolinate reductase [Oscillospiraceae bacterium MB08-C2-2]|nr:4-hydroxy-tetrahydrodipicolinate reductase [Oscillospiraceae bacterium MB08-C2-2]